MDVADETVLDADRMSEMIPPTLVAGTPQKHHRHHDDLLLDIHHLHTPGCDLREPEIADRATVAGAVESDRARCQWAAESGEAVLAPVRRFHRAGRSNRRSCRPGHSNGTGPHHWVSQWAWAGERAGAG
jgi:hypothetical protein